MISEPITDLGAGDCSGAWSQCAVDHPGAGVASQGSAEAFAVHAGSLQYVSIGLEAPYDRMLKAQDKDIAFLNNGLDA